MDATNLKELAEIILAHHYSAAIDLDPTTDKTKGLKNFVQMAINEIEKGDIREALLMLVDLRDDIGSSYICK